MVYTVYKGVGLGIGVVAADFDDTTQTVSDNFTATVLLPSTVLDLSTLESESRRIYV